MPAKYLAMYGRGADEPDERVRFRAVMTALDDAIGRVLAAVDETGGASGRSCGASPTTARSCSPAGGWKCSPTPRSASGGVTTYEGGVRVPAIVRWPGRVRPGTTCAAVLSTMDVLPTVLAACGARLPTDRILDGFDAWPACSPAKRHSPHETLCWAWTQGKDETGAGCGRATGSSSGRTDAAPWELYDLSNDVGETKNLAAARPEVAGELGRRFDEWAALAKEDRQREE